MSLIHEAANATRLPKVADQLRERYAELIDTYGERLPYGHNMPYGIGGGARFLRSLMLRLSPNPPQLPFESRVDRAQVSLTARFGSEEVTIRAVSQYASAKDSNWIKAGVERDLDDSNVYGDIILRRNEKPKIEYLGLLGLSEIDCPLPYMMRYVELYKELKTSLQLKQLLSDQKKSPES